MIKPETFPGLSSSQPQNSITEQSKWAVIKTKIGNIAKNIFYFLLGTVMFAINPTLFSISVLAGAIWDKQSQEIIEKINAVWMKQKWNITVMTAIAAYLAIQATWAVGSVYFAMNLGINLSQTE